MTAVFVTDLRFRGPGVLLGDHRDYLTKHVESYLIACGRHGAQWIAPKHVRFVDKIVEFPGAFVALPSDVEPVEERNVR